MSTLLLVIDPQNDFCDLPAHTLSAPGLPPSVVQPALPVPGADADLRRLAHWLTAHAGQVDAVTVTLDSHLRFDIAHPDFWRTADGAPVAPLTPITADDVRAGRFVTAAPAHASRALAYLDALQARGRHTHMVWPVHCELGSWGHGVHHALRQATADWQRQRLRAITTVIKGTNPWTEHYSALQAAVPDPQDAGTGLNTALLQQVGSASQVIIAGEASSHCVRHTVLDLLEHLPEDAARRLVLLTDCTSPVPGFEADHARLLAALQQAGATLARSTDFTPAQ